MKPLYWILIGTAVLYAIVIVAGAVCSWSYNQIVGCILCISIFPLVYATVNLIGNDGDSPRNKTYLVVFEGENNSQTIQRLKYFGEWARITKNSYVVVCRNKKASELRDFLLYYDNNGTTRILVVGITNKGWGSYGLERQVNDWLKEKI